MWRFYLNLWISNLSYPIYKKERRLGSFGSSLVCYFALATTAANAFGSRTAMSASILRLRVMFDFFIADTKRLYVVPFRRAAALMRAIHNLRRSRLRTRRSRVAYHRLFSMASLARLNKKCLAPRWPLVIFKIFLWRRCP